jgi:hypothetical protein
MLKGLFISLTFLMFSPTLLFGNNIALTGYWYGGGVDPFADGNELYCLQSQVDTRVDLVLSSDIDKCIYLYQNTILAEECKNKDAKLKLDINTNLYKVIAAPGYSVDGIAFQLNASSNDDIKFGRCSDFVTSTWLGVDVKDHNAIMLLAGMLTAILLASAFTYVLLTLGNF